MVATSSELATLPPHRALWLRTQKALADRTILLALCWVVALATRLAMVDVTITADEGFWMHRTLRFGAALASGDLANTYRSGHPGVTVMWTGLLGIGPERLAHFLPAMPFIDYATLQRVAGYLEALAAARRAMALVSAGLAVVIVALAWRLLGKGPGLVGGLLLLLDPYLVGMTRLLHPDALLASLMTISALAALIYWTRGGSRLYLVLAAVACGLALLTKAPAAHLAIFCGLLGLATPLPQRARLRQRLAPLLLFGAIAAGVYVVLWPTLWVEPLQRLGRVASFVLSVGGQPHTWPNFFLGQVIVGNPGPLYYPVALAYRLGPITLLGLLALLFGLRNRSARTAPLLWLLAYVVIFLALMSLGAKKFDRYALPAIMILDLLAGVGLWWLACRFETRRLLSAALGLVLLLQAVLLLRSYPYPIAAYNPLLGGAAGAQQAILVGWGEGLEQTAVYLNEQPQAESLVAKTLYDTVLRPRFAGTTLRFATPAPYDYFVIYVNMVQRGMVSPTISQTIAGRPPDFTALVNGVEYAWVYRIPREIQPPPTTLPEPAPSEDDTGDDAG